MNKFGLIMENWRQYLHEEKVEEALPFSSKSKMDKAMADVPEEEPSTGIKTVGDLKRFVKLLKLKNAGGAAGKKALSLLAGMLPGGGTILNVFGDIKDAGALLRKLYGMDDKYQSNTSMDALNIDDNISKIVDDPIETNFINYLIKDKFANASDDEKLTNYDATRLLQDYLADQFGGTTVKK
jgi:hypothetical protein